MYSAVNRLVRSVETSCPSSKCWSVAMPRSQIFMRFSSAKRMLCGWNCVDSKNCAHSIRITIGVLHEQKKVEKKLKIFFDGQIKMIPSDLGVSGSGRVCISPPQPPAWTMTSFVQVLLRRGPCCPKKLFGLWYFWMWKGFFSVIPARSHNRTASWQGDIVCEFFVLGRL